MLKVDIKKLRITHKDNTLVDISFNITTSTALIGESGSGKSLTLKSLLNLLPNSLDIQKDIQSNFELNHKTIGFIPQNPFTSLSPMTKISKQFFCSKEKQQKLLKLVDLPNEVLEKFPNQLSGGQIQRIIIAIALSNDVKILLLDEPTTALDIKNKENIIKLVDQLVKKFNILILFVTHDIESIRNLCEKILIINKGKIVEEGFTKEILQNPQEKYTKKLIDSNFKNKDFRK
ncbi:ATP-binding cassette domain-containing protein [Malaciobacter sp. WC5094]